MRKVVLLCTVFLLAGASVSGQDPTKVAPDAYKLQFENELVRVLRVHYAPKAKVPVHDHSRFPAAYVYLTDAGPVTFTHSDWEHPDLVRRAVQARSLRLSPTTTEAETHSVHNPGTKASDFLRIEFKTLKQGSGLAHGRFPPEALGRDFNKVVYENEGVRVTRSSAAPGSSIRLETAYPALLVYLADKPGETQWIPRADRRLVQNLTAAPIDVLLIEIKTK
jgi:hypothetical protein